MATTCTCNELTAGSPTKGLVPSHFESTTNNNQQAQRFPFNLLPSFGLAPVVIDRSISMALHFLRPGVPGMQPVGDLGTAKSAILFGVINGLLSPPVLELCLCTGPAGRPCGSGGDDDDDDAEQRYYQLANFVLAMLGVALLFVDMALSRAVFASPLWLPMVRWMVWLTKALTCGTLQFGVNLVYLCLRMLVFA